MLQFRRSEQHSLFKLLQVRLQRRLDTLKVRLQRRLDTLKVRLQRRFD
jgi:hypothetical protein